MSYQNVVTESEAIVLAAALLCEFSDAEVTDPLHCIRFETEAANALLFAMRVLHSKDQPVNVITVFEYLQLPASIERYGDAARALALPVITAIGLEVRSRAETLALIDGFCDAAGEAGQ